MTDDLNTPESPLTPSEPTVQPVSIHDTPHQGHGAWPLIAGMLGVFLVLESIALGYGVMRVVEIKGKIDTAKEKISERKEDLIVRLQDERPDLAFLSRLHTDTSIFGQTYLKGWMAQGERMPDEPICHDADDSDVVDYAYVAAGNWDTVLGQMMSSSDEVQRSHTQLMSYLAQGGNVGQWCDDGSRVLVTIMNSNGASTGYRIGQVVEWSHVGPGVGDWDWVTYQPINYAGDGFVLYPGLLEGADFIQTEVSEDATTDWQYYVTLSNMDTLLVESCSDAVVKGTGDGDSGFMGRQTTCKIQYVP